MQECPEREKQANASWGTTSWGTGFRQNQHQPNDEEVYQTSFPPLQEQHDDTKKDPLVQQSTPMNKSSRLQPVRMDFFDGKVTFQNGVTITHKNNDPTHEKMILEKYGIQKESTPSTSRESDSSSSSEKDDQQDTRLNAPAIPKKVRKANATEVKIPRYKQVTLRNANYKKKISRKKKKSKSKSKTKRFSTARTNHWPHSNVCAANPSRGQKDSLQPSALNARSCCTNATVTRTTLKRHTSSDRVIAQHAR
ncbi:unnamed protein product [Clavelina lepadiformis]|uniref:Uncharacterized protein n=1 Tax=Clavelina lepadiformis TaxID=159417 RepID=A0ABP0GD92_CLALP